ncbi:chromosome partitioning protein ParB [Burkholderia multivorans]|uniref:chromosome partitioning protein ParB n=1 Tax=Burkholderia multivorans TaxID=87883 RepID=UPI000CFFF9B8|nr:chromosome partitioning protein ParB [Burkholderia multivorans]MDN8003131.1 chromosome partitioning protein ParB [Burkholderia multivorans]PRH00208.1 chromosome partitioning protein ParB [Burkholderia multivorans]
MKKQGRPSATKDKAATLASLAGDVQMKRVNFQLPAEQHMKLKVYAAQHGKTITELLTEHVGRLVGNH